MPNKDKGKNQIANQETLRCFIAVSVPEELKQKIHEIQNKLNPEGIKLIAHENLHITLKFLGDVQSKDLSKVERVLREISFTAFNIHLHRFGVFPDEKYIRVIWVGCDSKELNILGEKINNALTGMFNKEDFTAHLTIARVKKKIDFHDFLEQHKNDDFGVFVCTGFELKQSMLGKEGPTYSTIAKFDAR